MAGAAVRRLERGTMVDKWCGDPVFWRASACNDERNTYRVFHRDKPGTVVAEFYGDNASAMAYRFLELFGEPSGHKSK